MNATKNTNVIQMHEYNGQGFPFREDGYFNMTKAAQAYGKRVSHFWDLPSTKEYVEALANAGFSDIWNSKRGNGGGTWGHPKLAVFFARWLDVRFSVWCDMTIDKILRNLVEVVPARGHEENPEVAQLVAELESLRKDYTKLLASVPQGDNPPQGWLAARTYLEDLGYSTKLINGIISEVASTASSYCARHHITVFTRARKDGSARADVGYYPPEALDHANNAIIGEGLRRIG